MKVLTYNIHGWREPDGAPNIDALAAVIASTGADLVGLNEVFHPMPTREGPALASLARRLRMSYAFGPTQPAAPVPDDLPYGNALLSRWPIQAHAAHHLTPTTGYGRRGLLEARVLLPAGAFFTVYVTHLDHRSEAIRLEQWSAATPWLQRDRSRPHLLIGDFNALAAGDYGGPGDVERLAAFQQARGWPLPAFDLVGQIQKSGYVDAFAQAGTGEGMTWPADAPERRIDYIFVPGVWAEALAECRCCDGPEVRLASDHLPVLAEFRPTAV